jgi:hypothetical protein
MVAFSLSHLPHTLKQLQRLHMKRRTNQAHACMQPQEQQHEQ